MSKKIQQCPTCINFQKRIKVIQADYEFQIKKMSQDKSSQKALYELNMNKQIRKLSDKLQKQKQERIQQNENWMKKYDELIHRQKQEMLEYKQMKDKEMEEYREKKEREVEVFKRERVDKLECNIKELRVEKEEMKRQFVEKSKEETQKLTKKYEERIQKLVVGHHEQIKKKCEQYEAVILGINSQKTVQQSLHKKTKQELKTTQSKLIQQIYGLKRNIIQHEERISCLKKQIETKTQEISKLNLVVKQNELKYLDNYEKLGLEYEEKYKNHRSEMEKKIEGLFKKQLENCKKYEKALQKMQEHRDIENQMYKANLEDIKNCIEQRPSRLEDIQQIIKLKQKLIKKERQYESVYEQLKWYKLQLENKQQTYNKIFGPDAKNNQNIYIRRKDLKVKKTGKSVTTIREILSANTNVNVPLAPLVGNLQKKLVPAKLTKIL